MSKTNQLQLLQHNLQNLLLQQQQIEAQVSEIESALEELKKTDRAYKIVGKIMLATGKDELRQDLQEKKEFAKIRLQNILKQEEQLKKRFEETQREVITELKKK